MSLPVMPVAITLTLLLSACANAPQDLATQRIATAEECLVGKCRFNNAPAKLDGSRIRLDGRSYEFQRLVEPLYFFDAQGGTWRAPERALTDGASIPRLFVPFIGFPNSPSFINAAALHDAYCGVGNESLPVYQSATWQEVHRLFYDALVASGTPKLKAQIMFAAVWLGGPRWYPNGQPDRTLDQISDQSKIQAFLKTKALIEAGKLNMAQLVQVMDSQVESMAQAVNAVPAIELVNQPPVGSDDNPIGVPIGNGVAGGSAPIAEEEPVVDADGPVVGGDSAIGGGGDGGDGGAPAGGDAVADGGALAGGTGGDGGAPAGGDAVADGGTLAGGNGGAGVGGAGEGSGDSVIGSGASTDGGTTGGGDSGGAAAGGITGGGGATGVPGGTAGGSGGGISWSGSVTIGGVTYTGSITGSGGNVTGNFTSSGGNGSGGTVSGSATIGNVTYTGEISGSNGSISGSYSPSGAGGAGGGAGASSSGDGSSTGG